jgi:hypothetical protein
MAQKLEEIRGCAQNYRASIESRVKEDKYPWIEVKVIAEDEAQPRVSPKNGH